MPALAVCAGLIVLAAEVVDGRADQQPLGVIDVTVRRNGYGRQRDSFEADLEIAELARRARFSGVFIRAPVIERVGNGVEVLADARRRARARAAGRDLVRYVSSGALGRPARARAVSRVRGAECPVTRNGIRSSTRRARPTRSAASSSRSSSARSRSRPARAVAIPTSNATLRSMVQKARDNSLPVDTIQRAIKRGTGEEEGVIYEQVSYEGYAAERRRGDRAGAHRQPQPHVGRDQEHLQPQRRVVRRARRGVVAVRAQGRRARRQGGRRRRAHAGRRRRRRRGRRRTSATRGR